MADSGGTDIVAGMAAVPAAGSRISDAQLYITGTGGIRGRPSASDGWNLAGIWADVRRSDAGTHSLFGTLRSPSDAEENTETGFHTAGAVSAAWICGEVRNALKVKMRKASITVEAVLVVPLVLMVIFLLLSLTFLYTHGAGIHLRHMKAQCLPPVKAVCLWKRRGSRPKPDGMVDFPDTASG